MTYLLAGDLGGTKTLLRLVKSESPDRSEFEYIYQSQAYPGLVAIAQEFQEDDETRVVILTGKGKSFCVGADMNMFADGLDREK